MPSPQDIFALGNAAVVAPAGHGKTEVIANVAALGRRALVLTHTHAGVHAIRSRVKRLGIPQHAVAVDTIAGWCMRYTHAFPGIARPCDGMPRTSAEWEHLYRGAVLALSVSAVRDVIASSYDRVLIDEYQDCNHGQHQLAIALSGIVPTIIFGDPMQGIFEFAGATLSWEREIHNHFPFAGTLETPHRWAGKNPELGAWIAQTRQKLMAGEPIDLADGPITYRQSDDAFDMATFFDGIDAREGTQAAIHCNKAICYRLAQATRGGFQAIEEMAAGRLQNFAAAWDASPNQDQRLAAINSLMQECFHVKQLAENEAPNQDDAAMAEEMGLVAADLGGKAGALAAHRLFAIAKMRPNWRLFRREIWRDGEKAIAELGAERVKSMTEAAASIRQRVTNSGRKMPLRTVSTPLLLKGLEFDHVVIPNAAHFLGERSANAKLFYVAISRATQTLTISASNRLIVFPKPQI
ncbi:UvrD-helicase domain-containing protein [Janthinobacterium sp. 64]|uniref:UvrD-helicase domain-containing protein n=1 Tax=Janthinobacterium sp. 64 TaxID=2035208 RepID=UPI000C2BE77A|nr:UvrD-helicase domain-containing protein [Janthinobacterium sp. 64]PKB13828.1 DNA helicase-2/ATP-dependent DNA helicase PcrA [Janthinobacterium sp. 64]